MKTENGIAERWEGEGPGQEVMWKAIPLAVREENEECARIADHYAEQLPNGIASVIARAIRENLGWREKVARNPKKEK